MNQRNNDYSKINEIVIKVEIKNKNYLNLLTKTKNITDNDEEL